MDIARKVAAFTAVCACVSNSGFTASAWADSPKRIGSTSLCGDAYLRALDVEGLAALSWQSRSQLSRSSEAEKALPQIWDDPEVILGARLDHIVFGPGEGSQSSKFLRDGTEATSLNWTEDMDGVYANLETLGVALGRSARPAIQSLQQRLSALTLPDQKPRILYLSRSGGTGGPGTFADTVIRAAGGENLITTAGWHGTEMETLIGLKPDLILTSYFEDGYDSVNSNPVRHQAFKDYIADYPRFEIPGALWPCAGPGLIEAAERLNARILELAE